MEALLHVNHLEKNLDEFVLKDVNLTLQPIYYGIDWCEWDRKDNTDTDDFKFV